MVIASIPKLGNCLLELPVPAFIKPAIASSKPPHTTKQVSTRLLCTYGLP
eukprot:XP_001704972.1 Hypothetical protein GL50803_123887 [Giardia lamblia ATCC 50803]